MAKNKKQVYKDGGGGDPAASLEFAKEHLVELKASTVLQAQLKADAKGDWQEYNVRLYSPLGHEFWFSGLNCGYKGAGPRTLAKVLKLIDWNLNLEVIFINEKLQIARELSGADEEEDTE